MDKQHLLYLIIDRLHANLQRAIEAAKAAHETATHEENIAENKYDTLGLEAAYLAAGHSKRVDDIRHALQAYHTLIVRPYDPAQGVQLSAGVTLASEDGHKQVFFLGPAAAGLKLKSGAAEVMVITPKAPLGHALLGKQIGDEVQIEINGISQTFEILQVS
ncbi:GreA/GreB family elongation factor [Pseudomonas duriflava]|nr:GreA/GreB family elongation factor [Pseudomonas duriflava]